MKSIKEIYEKELWEPYKTQALKNYADNPIDTYAYDLKTAVLRGFDWSKTSEEHNYWEELYYEII